MSAFLDAANELDELRRRVEQLEALVLAEKSDDPPRTAYRVREVAMLVGLKPQTVRDWIADGRLEAEDMGGWYSITPAAVEKAFGNRRRRRAVAS